MGKEFAGMIVEKDITIVLLFRFWALANGLPCFKSSALQPDEVFDIESGRGEGLAGGFVIRRAAISFDLSIDQRLVGDSMIDDGIEGGIWHEACGFFAIVTGLQVRHASETCLIDDGVSPMKARFDDVRPRLCDEGGINFSRHYHDFRK